MNLIPNLANCAAGCCTIPILQQPVAELAMQGTPVCDSLTVSPAWRKVAAPGMRHRSALKHPRCAARTL